MQINYKKSIGDLVGRVAKKVEITEENGDDKFVLRLDNGEVVSFFHPQDCCEIVYIEDCNGDLADLEGTPILVAEERGCELDPLSEYTESYTWTFYTFRTIKGSVDIRWYGSSNGYYSERVDLSWKEA